MNKRRHNFLLLVLALLCIAALVVSCEKKSEKKVDVSQEADVAAVTTSPQVTESEHTPKHNSQTGMVELLSSDIAFQVGDLKVSWGELLNWFNNTGNVTKVKKNIEAEDEESFINGLDVAQQMAAKKQLKVILRMQILMNEARQADVSVSDKDKEDFAKRWSEAQNGKDFNEYLAHFPLQSSNPLQPSRDDMFTILKYTDSLLKDVQIPEDVLSSQKQRVAQVRSGFEAQEAQRLKEFQKIPDMEGFDTDDGFMKLAKEFSEGVDADKGGVLDDLLTRQELTELNYGKVFDTEVGHSSSLIETPNGYRYIRVLEVCAPEMTGGDERLKIAQILLVKNELEGVPTIEEVERMVKNYFQEFYLAEHLEKALQTMEFNCPLFPEIRNDWPVPANLRKKAQ